MNKLFLHHRYIDLPPRDLSGNGNHGIPYSLTGGQGDMRYSARFDGAKSCIQVPASSSMSDLVQFRVQIVFRLDPGAPAARMNLAEGDSCFAIFVDADRSLKLSIFDRDGDWAVCSSKPGIVAVDRWHTVVAAHDGISEARIAVDADVVARGANLRGPVRSVGGSGVAIGGWPSLMYLFRGHLSEIALYRLDPEPELNLLFGAPCVDRATITKVVGILQGRMGESGMMRWADSFRGLVVDTAQAVQTTSDDVDTLQSLMRSAAVALGTRDQAGFMQAFGTLSEQAQRSLPGDQRAKLVSRFDGLRRQLALDDNELQELVHAACLDGLFKAKG